MLEKMSDLLIWRCKWTRWLWGPKPSGWCPSSLRPATPPSPFQYSLPPSAFSRQWTGFLPQGTGRVTRTLVLPDRISLLRFHFHTIQEGSPARLSSAFPPLTARWLLLAERLLDPLLLQSLLSVSPFKCVLVTYTQGNEESLKQAQILVNLYRDHLFLLLKTSWKRAAVPHSCCAQTMRLARRISTQSRDPTKSHCGKLEPKPEQCQHNACGALCCRGRCACLLALIESNFSPSTPLVLCTLATLTPNLCRKSSHQQLWRRGHACWWRLSPSPRCHHCRHSFLFRFPTWQHPLAHRSFPG